MSFVCLLTQLILGQGQVLLHQVLRGAEGRVHAAAHQLGRPALQHRADAAAQRRPGLLHAALHGTSGLQDRAAQGVGNRVLGPGHRARHHVLGRGHGVLSGGDNLRKEQSKQDKTLAITT